ncbi:Pentatricopeptide repeat-containing protein [Capsicum annuum]|uniref:Pentatricopeptide repeat-containing protein n=1 Tax=Capsicum annuum TaxID=4072 RepID=A0A2G2Y7C7_CAPAN|nr:Pentatricopeptide repeat-containing protein [Capsicum annuum]
MCMKCRELDVPHNIFANMPIKDSVSWNSIISGYASKGIWSKAFELFDKMREAGFEEHLLLWNSLVDIYARSEKVAVARRIFNLMSKKHVVTYTSLIAGYGIQGEGREAIELFNEMIRLHIKPDHVTMIAALSACSHSGLVMQGQKLFDQMQSTYGITPHLEHFFCMVDLFGRVGLLKKEKEIIMKIPYEPTPEMWATLLRACKIHRNTEIGEWVAEKLLDLKPDNPRYYVLIANMYANARRWNKLAEVRTVMQDFGVRKSPGCAWVNTGSGFSPFLVADTTSG